MTVAQLIEELKDKDQNLKVVVHCETTESQGMLQGILICNHVTIPYDKGDTVYSDGTLSSGESCLVLSALGIYTNKK
jgi:hypothetical protein